jgi:hypothetical protein
MRPPWMSQLAQRPLHTCCHTAPHLRQHTWSKAGTWPRNARASWWTCCPADPAAANGVPEPPRARRVSAHSAAARAAVLPTLLLGLYPAPRRCAAASHSHSHRATLRRRAAACPPQRAKHTSAAYLGGVLEGPARPWPMAHATTRPAAPPSASATGLSAAPRWERLRDHGHGRRPSPTQTAPRGGRSRDYLVGGGRSASHVPYPDLAGRHRGQAAIGATGVTGATLSTAFFYRDRCEGSALPPLHAQSLRTRPGAASSEVQYNCSTNLR